MDYPFEGFLFNVLSLKKVANKIKKQVNKLERIQITIFK